MIQLDDNVIEIIRKQDRTISAANQSFFDSLPATEQRIFAAVSKHVQKFSSDGENFVFDDGNTLLTNQVERIILEALQSSKYPSDVNGFLRNFENIKQFNFDVHGNVNDLTPEQLGELINPIQRATVEQTLQGLTGSGVSTNFLEPLRTGIFQNVVAGATKSDLEAYLRRFILGNPDVDGLLSRYVKQVSRDALNQFDGQVNAKIANEFGLDAYRYVGSLIEDSRPQCRRWVAMQVIQKKDLPSEIAWMNANGTGAIPGTSPETFSIYRGGYNCRHSAIPFKLTKSQREKLNLEPAAVEPEQIAIDNKFKKIKRTVLNSENVNFSKEDENRYLEISGIPNDAKGNVQILVNSQPKSFTGKEREIYEVIVEFKGDGVQMVRKLYPIVKTCKNEYFRIDDNSKFKGKGANLFSNQVNSLTENGYKKISTMAARGVIYNGYYTWSRLGYLPPESIVSKYIGDFNNQNNTSVKDWGEFMSTKQGQEFWKKNGVGFDGIFDLSNESYSQNNLRNYIEQKSKK